MGHAGGKGCFLGGPDTLCGGGGGACLPAFFEIVGAMPKPPPTHPG